MISNLSISVALGEKKGDSHSYEDHSTVWSLFCWNTQSISKEILNEAVLFHI